MLIRNLHAQCRLTVHAQPQAHCWAVHAQSDVIVRAHCTVYAQSFFSTAGDALPN